MGCPLFYIRNLEKTFIQQTYGFIRSTNKVYVTGYVYFKNKKIKTVPGMAKRWIQNDRMRGIQKGSIQQAQIQHDQLSSFQQILIDSSMTKKIQDYVISKSTFKNIIQNIYHTVEKKLPVFNYEISLFEFLKNKAIENKRKILDFLKDNQQPILAALTYVAALLVHKMQETDFSKKLLEEWLKMNQLAQMNILEKLIELVFFYKEQDLTDIEAFKSLFGKDAILALKDESWANLQKNIIKNFKEFVLKADLNKDTVRPLVNILMNELSIKIVDIILEDKGIKEEYVNQLRLDVFEILNHFYEKLTMEDFFEIMEDPHLGDYLFAIENAPNRVYKVYYITEAIKSIPALNIILDDSSLFEKIDNLNQSIDKLTDNYTTIDWIFDSLLGPHGKNKAVQSINYCMNQLNYYLGSSYIKPLLLFSQSNQSNKTDENSQKLNRRI